jgi:hypothetical protein
VEFFALLMYQDVPTQAKAFPTGTRMSFNQTLAPTGWTKDTSAVYNDASIRLTTGTVGIGGTDAFTTVYGVGKVTGSHANTQSEMPPHVHGGVYGGGASDQGNPQPSANSAIVDVRAPINTGSAGGGAGHTHTLTMNLKFADFIIATID